MKTIVQLHVLPPAKLREKLNSVHPSAGSSSYEYSCEIDLEDPRLRAIEQTLSANGYSRWPGTRRADFDTEYAVTYIRKYDESDWEAAEFLEIHPETQVGRLGKSEDGGVSLPGLDLKPDEVTVANAFFHETVMPERSKVELERQQLLGVEFFKATIRADKTEDPDTVLRMGEEDLPPYRGEPWWELRSRIELPPVSDIMTLVNGNEQPVQRGTSRRVLAREGRYNHQELHYRRQDVRQFPGFDLARTWEEWTGCPVLVASKRFFRVCRELGLDMGWIPVRIDE